MVAVASELLVLVVFIIVWSGGVCSSTAALVSACMVGPMYSRGVGRKKLRQWVDLGARGEEWNRSWRLEIGDWAKRPRVVKGVPQHNSSEKCVFD